MKKILKSFAFAMVGVFAVTALASCGGHVHEFTSYESDNTKHRGVCEADGEKTEWEAHVWGEWTVTKEPTEDAKGSQKHTCTVCGKEVAEEIKELQPETGVATEVMAVYAQVPESWENVNIYYWNSLSGEDNTLSPNLAVVWPGVAMTLVNETNHIWGFKIPVGVNSVIFNDGSAQTVDIQLAMNRNLYVLDDEVNSESKYDFSYKVYTPTANDPELAGAVEVDLTKGTVYFQVPADWETVMVHHWGTDGTDWPGVEATVVDADNHIYMFEDFTLSNGFLVHNNNGVQTVNLKLELADANAVVVQSDADEQGHLFASYAKYADEKLTEVKLVTTYVQVPADWEGAYAYWWGTADAPTWPGVEMTVVDEANHIYSYELSSLVGTVIFSEGDGKRQTENLDIPAGAFAFTLTNGEGTAKATGTPCTYNPETKEFTPVEVEEVTPEFYVVGGMNGWTFNADCKLNINTEETEATIEIALEAGAMFKVATEGYKKEFGYQDSLSEAFANDNGNIKVVTAGTYVITVSNLQDNPTLSIAPKAA